MKFSLQHLGALTAAQLGLPRYSPLDDYLDSSIEWTLTIDCTAVMPEVGYTGMIRLESHESGEETVRLFWQEMDQEELRHRIRNKPLRLKNGNALASDPIHRKYMNDPKYNRKAFEI
jgi:hypothetical protein